jgi:hypothetical protein
MTQKQEPKQPKPSTLGIKARKLIEKYVKLVEKLGRYPARGELEDAGITRDAWRHHFANLEGVQKEAKSLFPKVFEKLFSDADFTSARFKDTRSALKDVNEFIICTAISGRALFMPAFQALKTWMRHTEGLALFTPQKDTASTGVGGGNKVRYFFDPRLKGCDIIWKDLKLNNKVTISEFKTIAKAINPHTGAERIADKAGLTVIPSPKSRLTALANMEGFPGYLISGGAITVNDYSTARYDSLRTGKIAKAEHHLGGIYVKLLGKNRYEFTPIEFDLVDGHFTVGGMSFFADGKVKDAAVEVVDFGDIHAQEMSYWMREEFFRILQKETPKRIGLHDVFSGITISPFNSSKIEYQFLENKEYGATTLKAELENTGKLICEAANYVGTVDIIDSNHHKFLEYWIAGGKYRLGNPENIRMAHEIAAAWLKDPHTPILKTALAVAGVEIPSNVIFHKSYKSLKTKGIERQHGHAGSSGQKGISLAKLAEELGASNTMHRHTCGIIGRAWCGGTWSGVADKRPNYARAGANKQANAYIKIYSDGQRELVHVFEP